ncbi:MAG: hypothetical protein KME14_14720 [Tildeniella torsiva UHER 1998/13D]|jgi:hypothetical protein|nr:hypothetical protein [Tildeniella torsiva UHER 1998/13D]
MLSNKLEAIEVQQKQISASEYQANSSSSSEIEITQQLLDKLSSKLVEANMCATAQRLMARRWKTIDTYVNLPSTILATISGASFLSETKNTNLVAFLTIGIAILTVLNTFASPNQKFNDHFDSFSKYSDVRSKIDMFLSLYCLKDKSGEKYKYQVVKENHGLGSHEWLRENQQTIEDLIKEFYAVEAKAPLTARWATKRSQFLVIERLKKATQLPSEKSSKRLKWLRVIVGFIYAKRC